MCRERLRAAECHPRRAGGGAAGLVAAALLGACHALARVKGPRDDRVVIDTRVAAISHALVVVLLALVFIEDPVDLVERLPFVRTHTLTAYWVLAGIALTLTGGLTLLLRALCPGRILHLRLRRHLAQTLPGALLVHPPERGRASLGPVRAPGRLYPLAGDESGGRARAGGRLAESTIIVHGDHGSRIRTNLTSGSEAPGEALGLRTRLDFLATHFAVKPGAFPLEPARYAGRKRWETLDNLLAERMGWPKVPVTPPAERPAARR